MKPRVSPVHLSAALLVLVLEATNPAYGQGVASAARQENARRFTTVTSVAAADGVAVTLTASGGFSPSFVGIAPDSPPRIWLDVPGVLPGAVSTAGTARGSVTGVRLQPAAAGATRITIDLSGPVLYSVMPRPDVRELTVIIVSAGAQEPPAPGRAAPAPPTIQRRVQPRAVPAAQAVAPIAARAVAASANQVSPPAPSAQMRPPATPPVPPRTAIGFRGGSRSYGRVSIYANQSRVAVPGRATVAAGQVVTSVALHAGDRSDNGVEYGLDMRQASYFSTAREPRTSVYEGFVGARLRNGTVRARGGHMWVNDLGALGSIAGGLLEVRRAEDSSGGLRLRGAVFGGVEPLAYELGYASGVQKYGALIALDGAGARRHVAGYVQVRHAGITERSVLSFTNFLPMGRKVFIYQAAEYDVQPPSGQGRTGLNYFFANGRFSVAPRLELQVTANRGRAIDLRALSDDVVAGRPVATRTVDGLLYQSVGGRATVETWRGARVYAGYSQDRNNRDDVPTARWLVGSFLSNIGGTGLDLTFSDNLMDRETGRFHSRYLSVGRQTGRRLYVSGDYSTSLSIIRFLRSDGLSVEMRPATSRAGASAVVILGRRITLLGTGEYMRDGDVRDLRVTTGATYRLR